MESLQALGLGVFWNPEWWVSAATTMGLIWAAIALGAGLFVRLLGANGLMFRLVLVGLYAGLIWLIGPQLTAGSPDLAALIRHPVPILIASILLSLFTPIAFFVFFGAIGGFIGGNLAGGFPFWQGFLAGALLLGALSYFLRPFVAIVVSRMLAAILIGVALIRFLSIVGLAETFRAHSVIVVGIILAWGLFGAIRGLARGNH